jgi:hypothetical protein
MKMYHSFWEKGYRNIDENLYNMHKLSVLAALKSHGNIHLITTEWGKNFLGNLPYTSIELFEENINPDYSRVWAISKLYAYKQIIKKGEPFLHIDYDVFLFKTLPIRIINGGIICQQLEGEELISNTYYLHDFENHCKNKYLYNPVVRHAYNTGIFGGNDLKSISFYLNQAFKLLFDKENEYYWLHLNSATYLTYTLVIEQYWLSQCLFYLNLTPTLIFDTYMTEDIAKELGYTHLMAAKNDIYIQDKIKNKIRQYENI